MAPADDGTTTVEMSENLMQAVGYAFQEAMSKLADGSELQPFTVILNGENLTIEEHDGEDDDECRASAQRAINVDPASVDGYAYAYDGFIQTGLDPDDTQDAIIVECAEYDDDHATVLCKIYDQEALEEFTRRQAAGEESLQVDDGMYVIGEIESMIPEDFRETGSK